MTFQRRPKSALANWLGFRPACVLALSCLVQPAFAGSHDTRPTSGMGATPTNQWAVRLEKGQDAGMVAAQVGATGFRRLGRLPDIYVFDIPLSDSGAQRSAAESRLGRHPGIAWMEQQVARQQQTRVPTDPYFISQWHLLNTGQTGGVAGQDANVVPAWDLGYAGTGVVIGVVDDGLQHGHPDLSPNYRPDLSWDFDFNDADPSPDVASNFHGTSAAGVAAARDDGSSCGVGAAYRAQLAGLRLIATASTDAMEADALSYDYGQIHIYSSSWGPTDDGLRLEGPGTLTQAAIADAVANGRGGLGSIHVWAGGNGAGDGDNVNYDGYANSRYVNAIAALTDSGLQAYYSEPGAPLIVAAPSSGGIAGITTTDLLGASGYNNSASPVGDCTSGFGGTSAAAPLVAGVTALMVEANPNLGWRDVKHLLLATAAKNDSGNSGWTNNGAGRHVNHAYGYGRVDAGAAVAAAGRQTRNLGPEIAFDSGVLAVAVPIPDNNATGVVASFTAAGSLIVEHVEVVFDATHTFRGDLRVVLTSPAGTQSVLADVHDDANSDFPNWKFTSIRHWGELASGTWSIRVSDGTSADTGTFASWRLIIHGRHPALADVGTTQWSWRNIEALYQTGITDGCRPGAFCPDDVVTRAQMAVFLERATRGGTYVPPTCTGTIFADVGPATFACNWIEQLFADGITTGCGGGIYCPESPVSRTQMAIFLLRAKHGASYAPPTCTGLVFGDVSASTYGCAWIEQLAAEGITTGCGGGNYCPNQSVDRAQMAAFLTRAFTLVQP